MTERTFNLEDPKDCIDFIIAITDELTSNMKVGAIRRLDQAIATLAKTIQVEDKDQEHG